MDLELAIEVMNVIFESDWSQPRVDAWQTIKSAVLNQQTTNRAMDAIAAYIKESQQPVTGEGKEYSVETSDCRREFIAKYVDIFTEVTAQVARGVVCNLQKELLQTSPNRQSTPCFYCGDGKDVILIKEGSTCCPNCKRTI